MDRKPEKKTLLGGEGGDYEEREKRKEEKRGDQDGNAM